MAQSAVEPYEALTTAPDDKTRAKLIAEAFERLEERYPHLPNLVTQTQLRETELRLLKEIERLRGDVRTEIEQLRGGVRTDTQLLRGEIVRAKIDVLKWIVPLMFGQVIAIAALVKLL